MLRLKKLRESKRLNQEGLAMQLSVSQSTISAYEVGERTPDLKTLMAIARFFEVSIDYLVGLSEVKHPMSESSLPFSEDELEYVMRYKKASGLQREKIKAYMDGLLDQ